MVSKLLIILLGFSHIQNCTTIIGKTQKQIMHQKKINTTREIPYLLYLPTDKPKKKSYPLILFLHGAGERGTDLSLVEKHGPPALIRKKEFPYSFIILAPQCPKKVWWPEKTKELMQILEYVKEKYPVDNKRIYLTGLSMGGFGSWALAQENPDTFAAIVPICGGGKTDTICRLKNKPIWAFHGQKDKVVPQEKSKIMVNALKQCGSKQIQYTTYPDLAHNSWSITYTNPELYQWLLSHSNDK